MLLLYNLPVTDWDTRNRSTLQAPYSVLGQPPAAGRFGDVRGLPGLPEFDGPIRRKADEDSEIDGRKGDNPQCILPGKRSGIEGIRSGQGEGMMDPEGWGNGKNGPSRLFAPGGREVFLKFKT